MSQVNMSEGEAKSILSLVGKRQFQIVKEKGCTLSEARLLACKEVAETYNPPLDYQQMMKAILVIMRDLKKQKKIEKQALVKAPQATLFDQLPTTPYIKEQKKEPVEQPFKTQPIREIKKEEAQMSSQSTQDCISRLKIDEVNSMLLPKRYRMLCECSNTIPSDAICSLLTGQSRSVFYRLRKDLETEGYVFKNHRDHTIEVVFRPQKPYNNELIEIKNLPKSFDQEIKNKNEKIYTLSESDLTRIMQNVLRGK